jgi:hypothetical protein
VGDVAREFKKQSITLCCYIKNPQKLFITLSSKKAPWIAQENSIIVHLSTEDPIQPKNLMAIVTNKNATKINNKPKIDYII